MCDTYASPQIIDIPNHFSLWQSYHTDLVLVKGMVGPLAAELGVHGIRVNSISPGPYQMGSISHRKNQLMCL